MDVTATVTREDGLDGRHWWVATIEGGGATQARRLDQLVNAVAEAVIVRHDLPDDAEVTVSLDLSGVPELAELIDAAQEADAAAERAAADAVAARENLARGTRDLTVRDLAVALGVSHQTAARIRRQADAVPTRAQRTGVTA
jgi:hypothetical protein